MARWEPDARGRLIRAAIDLFAEQGYDRTTVAEIAERAGLTKTTFFRHFPDKREVLFIGQASLMEHARTGIAAAPANGDLLATVTAGIEAMASAHTDQQREYGLQLGAVVAANEELRERAAFKRASIAGAIAKALVERGESPLTAELAADLGVRAYYLGFERWVQPKNKRSMTTLCRQALVEIRTAVSALI